MFTQKCHFYSDSSPLSHEAHSLNIAHNLDKLISNNLEQ